MIVSSGREDVSERRLGRLFEKGCLLEVCLFCPAPFICLAARKVPVKAGALTVILDHEAMLRMRTTYRSKWDRKNLGVWRPLPKFCTGPELSDSGLLFWKRIDFCVFKPPLL